MKACHFQWRRVFNRRDTIFLHHELLARSHEHPLRPPFLINHLRPSQHCLIAVTLPISPPPLSIALDGTTPKTQRTED